MNKFLVFALVSLALVAFVSSAKKISPCVHENCPEEVDAYEKMQETKKQECQTTCNPEDKVMRDLLRPEKRAIKECMRNNSCTNSFLKKSFKTSAEFEALKTCADNKCPGEMGKKKKK